MIKDSSICECGAWSTTRRSRGLQVGIPRSSTRGDPLTIALLKRELVARRAPITHGGVIGQVWRSGAGRQARLARLLSALEIVPLDRSLGQRAGLLLGRARKSDVVDAAVVVLAADGDTILTSDVHDLEALASAAGLHVDIAVV